MRIEFAVSSFKFLSIASFRVWFLSMDGKFSGAAELRFASQGLQLFYSDKFSFFTLEPTYSVLLRSIPSLEIFMTFECLPSLVFFFLLNSILSFNSRFDILILYTYMHFIACAFDVPVHSIYFHWWLTRICIASHKLNCECSWHCWWNDINCIFGFS